VIVIVVTLLATITITTACSGQGGVTARPSVSAASGVTAAPAPRVVTAAPAPRVVTAAPAPRVVKAAFLARSVPVRLQIPAIGVDSKLMDLGLRADGSMQVPPGGFPAGWYTGAPTPGEAGPAIIAGHVDWNGPGVFYDLHNLKPGDLVSVTRQDGSKPVFRVTQVEQFPKEHFPTTLVYGDIDHAGLRLITCGGSFNRQTGSYEDDIVAFADLVAPSP
jgi:Sortase domain